jgi:uncharacterized sodium:solute symporter family permease YidK
LKSTFNTGFYATAATVIPVLYLALSLQGSTFDAMSSWLGKFSIKNFGRSKDAERRYWSAFFVITVTVCLLIQSFFGEISAIDALYSRQSSASTSRFVLISLIILLVGVICVTSMRFIVIYYNVSREKLNEKLKADALLEPEVSAQDDDAG